MFSMNCEWHEGIKDLPYHVIFGRYPPVGIFPGAEKHCVDEEDLPITSACDDPHTVSLHTETSILRQQHKIISYLHLSEMMN